MPDATASSVNPDKHQQSADTLPSLAPDDENFAAFRAADDGGKVIDWLRDNDFDPARILNALGTVKLLKLHPDMEYRLGATPGTGTLMLDIRAGEPDHLVFPIIEGGQWVDLACWEVLDHECVPSFRVFTLADAPWLGRDNIAGPRVRLHHSVFSWLGAGCSGCVSIHPFQRTHLKDLAAVDTIECNEISTATEAWEWGFGGLDEALSRFLIDDEPENVTDYFKREAFWQAATARRAA